MAEHRVRKDNIIYIIPDDELFAQRLGHSLGEHRLSRARLALDEKRFFERHRDVHRIHQLRARNVVFAAFESIFHSVLLAKNQNQ